MIIARLILILILTGWMGSWPGSRAFAIMSAEDRRRDRADSMEDLKYSEGSPTQPGIWRRGWLVDYGSNLSLSYTASENEDRQDTVQDSLDHSWAQEIRLYGLAQNRAASSKFYARAAARFLENRGISHAIKRRDVDGPHVELLYWEQQFRVPARHRLRLGRQFVALGRGLAFGLTVDGMHWEVDQGRWNLRTILVRQNPGDDNIDLLSPGSGRTKRRFAGLEGRYRLNPQESVWLFALMNKDRNVGETVAGQKYQLDSRYYGLGLEFTPISRWMVWGELVVETGKTYPHLGTASKVSVYATAFDLGARFFFGGSLSPTLYAELAGASGDKDRQGNVYSSSGGSTAGRDTVFRGFGGLSFGSALAPTFANLHAYKFGASVKPLARSRFRMLTDLTVQSTLYHYLAEDEAGPTSDPVYNVAPAGLGDNIGREYDFQISWKAKLDFRTVVQYGVFIPGPAYGANRSREDHFKLKMAFDL